MNTDIAKIALLLECVSDSLKRQIPKEIDKSVPFPCCPVCGCVKVDDNTNFCPSCGQKLFYSLKVPEQEINLSGNLCSMCLNLECEAFGLSCSAGRHVRDKNFCVNFESK